MTYKKEVEFFRTQLEEVYKNTSVLVTTLQNVEVSVQLIPVVYIHSNIKSEINSNTWFNSSFISQKEKKKAEEMKREQENERMMEVSSI